MAIYEVVLRATQDSEPMLTVLHYDVVGSNDMQLFTDAIGAELDASLAPLIVGSVTWTGATIRLDQPGQVGIPYTFTGGQVVGGASSLEYAALVAANVRKLASTGMRPAQGRIYQGGIPVSSFTSDGHLTPGMQSALDTAWGALRIIEFDGAGEATMQIKASNPAAPNTAPYNPVSSISTLRRLSKQSRRNWAT